MIDGVLALALAGPTRRRLFAARRSAIGDHLRRQWRAGFADVQAGYTWVEKAGGANM